MKYIILLIAMFFSSISLFGMERRNGKFLPVTYIANGNSSSFSDSNTNSSSESSFTSDNQTYEELISEEDIQEPQEQEIDLESSDEELESTSEWSEDSEGKIEVFIYQRCMTKFSELLIEHDLFRHSSTGSIKWEDYLPPEDEVYKTIAQPNQQNAGQELNNNRDGRRPGERHVLG